MTTTNDYFKRSSFGAMSLSWTFTPILKVGKHLKPNANDLLWYYCETRGFGKVNYAGATCASLPSLDYWAGQSSSALDVMAIAAANQAGYGVGTYDISLVKLITTFLWMKTKVEESMLFIEMYFFKTQVFVPTCSMSMSTGIGWIGAPGALLYTQGFSLVLCSRIHKDCGQKMMCWANLLFCSQHGITERRLRTRWGTSIKSCLLKEIKSYLFDWFD